MIDENKTLELFGYTSDSLSHGSGRKVVAICNKCGKERVLSFRQYRNLCISCTKRGINHTLETRQKISKTNSGKKFSEEHKQKISKAKIGKNNPMFGKKLSEDTKQKMSKSHIGENNPNWQGGITPHLYCSKFNEKIKEEIREEFNRQCFLCGILECECSIKLSVHHVDYDRTQGCNSDWKLVPLCTSCHSKTSGKHIRDYYEEFISRLLYIRELIFEYDGKIDYKGM